MNATTIDAGYGPYNGHPLDPRTPEPTEDEDEADDKRQAALSVIDSMRAVLRDLEADEEDPGRYTAQVDASLREAKELIDELFCKWLPEGALQ